MYTLTLVNPNIVGTISTQVTESTIEEGVRKIFDTILEHVKNNIPEMCFTVKKDNGEYLSFCANEKINSNRETEYTITEISHLVKKIKNLEEGLKPPQNGGNKIQSGGKLGSFRDIDWDDDSSDSSSDSDSSDSDERELRYYRDRDRKKKKKKKHSTVISPYTFFYVPDNNLIDYWIYNPLMYPDYDSFFVPVFDDTLQPYIWIKNF